MSKMVLQRVVVLSILVTQALSAPSRCTESCTSYHGQYQTSSGYQDHAGLTQVAAQLQDVHYAKPGNWTEHNEYGTDGGHGKVHEERGQYVEGPKQVRYYKKNYTSSYSTGYANGAGISEAEQNSNYRHSVHVPESQQIIDTQRTYDQRSELETIQRQHEYNRLQNERRMQLANRRTNAHSQRLEDFGEYSGNSQITQQAASGFHTETSQGQQHVDTEPGNWSRVDSYKTDGGHGRVFEEEGQYVAGPKKVRYYKRNYTSSYSNTGGVPITDIAAPGVPDLRQEIEKLHREIGRDFHQISSVGSTAATNIGHSNVDTISLGSDNVQTVASDSYRHRVGQHDAADMLSHASEHVPLVNPTQSVYGERHSYERHEGWSSKPQYINPTPGYTNVLVTGANTHRNTLNGGLTGQHAVDDLQQTEMFDAHQSKLVQDQISSGHVGQSIYNQNIATLPSTTGQVGHYKEHWSSSSHTRESSLPHLATDSMYTGEHNARYTGNQYGNQHHSYDSAASAQERESYQTQYRDRHYNSGYRTSSGRMTTGMVDGGHDTVDCDHGSGEQVQYGSRYHRKYKRDTKYAELSDLQQHQSADLTQQTHDMKGDDLVQQTDQLDDLQQTMGKLEFGQQSQQDEDDLTQQTGKLEFGQQSQYPWKPSTGNQHMEDLTQQNEDLTQQNEDLTQTTGKLEFGQNVEHPRPTWKPTTSHQETEDLTQHTGESDDLTQQTSGKIEFGQQSQHPYPSRRPSIGDRELEDLTQQTNKDFDDLTQQTGQLEFGQQSQHPYPSRRPGNGNQHIEDLTQQTHSGFDDLTQQTGQLEFGQQSQHPYPSRHPVTGNQHMEDLTQQTNKDFDDLTQQTGQLEFGQQSRHPYPTRRPGTGNQHMEDLTQQTNSDFDDLTQQTGQLEFGQQSRHPYPTRRPGTGNQHTEDLTQQTNKDFDDLTQQTGQLEFGQQSQHPYPTRRPGTGNQHMEDLTQQTNKDFDDLTQQTGQLEFGQQSQHPYPSRRPGTGNQHIEDLTQQTNSGFDDLTQQTGNLEFGQQLQHPYPTRRPGTGNQHIEDLTQQTNNGFDDLTQQTGKIEFGQQSQNSRRPGNQHLNDFNQQTGMLDDLTQQTSGKLEFGQQSQHSEDLTQQTDNFDDFTQQTGKLEFGQESQHHSQPWKPSTGNQHMEDLTQQNEDLTQQVGKLELHPYPQNPYFPKKPTSNQYPDDLSQTNEDFTQQTGGFNGMTSHNSKLEFGQQTQQTTGGKYDDSLQQTDIDNWNQGYQKPGNWHKEDLTQQTASNPFDVTSSNNEFGSRPHFDQQQNVGAPVEEQEPNHSSPKPAQKPKPRPRYSRVQSTSYDKPKSDNLQAESQKHDTFSTGNVYQQNSQHGEADTDNVRSGNIRGDQGLTNPTDKDSSQRTNTHGFDMGRGNGDQVNLLHKSNDATVGLQWHYTYHPSDLTNSEPAQDNFYQSHNIGIQQKEKPFGQQTDEDHDVQQQTKPMDFNTNQEQNTHRYGSVYQQSGHTQSQQSEHNFDQQDTQNKETFGSTYQQSGSQQSTYTFGHHVEPTPNVGRPQSQLGQQDVAHATKGGSRRRIQRPIQSSSLTNEENKEQEHKLEPRILEAYGGGPYDAAHSDDIYSGVTINPSATLPPINSADPWDIREIPGEVVPLNNEFANVRPLETTTGPLETSPEMTDSTETPPPSFWGRIGNKITNTFDKAKEKARGIFG